MLRHRVMNVTVDMDSQPRRFLIYHLPMIVYAAAIIGVSSIPSLHLPELRLVASDKLAHFCEYAVLAFLTFRSFTHLRRGLKPRYAVLWAGLFVVGFAFVDEAYQRLIPGRFSSGWDILADAVGGLLVLTILEVRGRWRERREGGV